MGHTIIHLANLISNALSSGPVSSKIRVILLNMLGNHIAINTRIAGGGYIYGSGLTIGQRCYIGRGVYIDLTAPVYIESNVVIGHGVTFVTAGHQIGLPQRRCGPVRAQKIMVQEGVWIGANVTVMPGVTIGAGSVVAAGALVLKSLPANSLAVGVPAIVARTLAEEPAG